MDASHVISKSEPEDLQGRHNQGAISAVESLGSGAYVCIPDGVHARLSNMPTARVGFISASVVRHSVDVGSDPLHHGFQ
jgi:hypothetical protein